MAKINTKAGETQLSQDMAATDAVAEEQQSATQEAAAAVVQEQASAPAPVTAPAPTPAPAAEDLVVTPVKPTAPVPTAAKAVVKEAAVPVAANASTADQLASILKAVPAAHQTDISRVQAYLERMAPGRPIDVKAGVSEQVALYRSIQNIVNRQEEYFTQLFSALLFLFKAEGAKGALSDRYRMRFMDNITLHVGDRKAFANLTQMLHILADPKSRSLALKQVNMERALENGLTAEGRKRVLDYFNV